MDAYHNLANAIVVLAVKDYRTALRRCRRHPQNIQYAKERDELERFFRSSWFGILTSLDGEVLMAKIRTEVAA